MSRISALFDNRAQAEAAVNELRQMGATDAHLSFIARHDDDHRHTDDTYVDETDETAGERTAKNTGVGVLTGAGVGALFGLAAAAIPGVGPFITAGALATALGSAAAGGAAAGAIVGGTSGAIAGALADAGYSHEEAEYYSGGVEQGGILVVVNTDSGLSEDQAVGVLTRHGGRSYAA